MRFGFGRRLWLLLAQDHWGGVINTVSITTNMNPVETYNLVKLKVNFNLTLFILLIQILKEKSINFKMNESYVLIETSSNNRYEVKKLKGTGRFTEKLQTD
jgi:hypothetical protein